jgi:2-C-methyl-D-erythritol 4-phosphate cytidylyltransferase
MSTTAIIVAAGSSKRMGFHKLSAELRGKPVLRWTIEAFDRCDDVDDLLIVVGEATREMVLEWAEDGLFTKPIIISEGGAERHLSVHEGLNQLPDATDLVAVHDGARPLIGREQISRCIARARECKAVACARPVTETLKRADSRGVITGNIDRDGAWVMETPQIFERSMLCRAYEQVVAQGTLVTDEVSAVQRLGVDVFVVENPLPNPKITFAADLLLAEQLMSRPA